MFALKVKGREYWSTILEKLFPNREIPKEFYRWLARELGDKLDEGNYNLLVHLPMEAGGISFGEPLAEELKKNGVPFETLPVSYDRYANGFRNPSPRQIGRVQRKSRALYSGFDDVIGSGKGMISLYLYLVKECGVAKADYIMSSLIDNTGATEGRCYKMWRGYDDAFDIDRKAKEMIEKGEIPKKVAYIGDDTMAVDTAIIEELLKKEPQKVSLRGVEKRLQDFFGLKGQQIIFTSRKEVDRFLEELMENMEGELAMAEIYDR